MKKYYLVFVLMLFVANTFSQVIDEKNDAKTVHPDDVFFWDTEHDEWDLNSIDKDHYRFYNLGGEIYAFRGRKDGNLLLYQHHSKTENEKSGMSRVCTLEDNGDSFSPLYDPVAFDYNGVYHALYYYQDRVSETVVIDKEAKTIYHPVYYGKHFYTTEGNVNNWNHQTRYTAKSSHNHRKLYRGAFSVGKYVYLIYDSYFKGDETSNGNPDYDILLYLSDKSINIDVCTINEDNELEVVNTHELHDVMGNSHHHPRAIDGFVHPDGHVRLLISYSGESTSDKENYGGGVILYSFANHKYMHLYSDDNFAYSVRAVHGSLKGKRDRSDLHQTAHPNRIQVLFNHFENHTIAGWEDEGKFYYKTFAVDGDEHKYYLCDHGQIILHADEEKPDEWNRMAMDVTTRITSEDKHAFVKGSDTFEKNIWMFHTDNDGYIYGDIFESDIMQTLDGSLSFNDDLDNVEKYGDTIRSLWSLIGITDGAPPCAIDWEKWEKAYPTNNTDPTELSYTHTLENEISQTDSYERSFYTETGVKAIWGDEDDGLSGGVHASFKYFNKIRRENTVTFKKEIEQEIPFVLRDSNQTKGWEIWSVPNIHRVSFACYPWWDNNMEHQIKGSFINMFFCTGNKLVLESVPIENMPYGITDPNNPTMESWYSDNNPSREMVVTNAAIYNVDNLSVTYNETNGQEATLKSTNTKSNSYQHTHGYEIKVGGEAQFKIPEVFQINVENEEGFEWSYEMTTEHSTSVSNAFSVSLKNLTTPEEHGILVDKLDITTYFFANNEEKSINYWYYDYYNPEGKDKTVKPWYIAHVVTASNQTDDLGGEEPTFIETLNNENSKPIIFPTIGDGTRLKIKNFTYPVKELLVYSISGELIVKKNVRSLPNETSEILLQKRMSTGTYLAKMITQIGCTTQKIIVR